MYLESIGAIDDVTVFGADSETDRELKSLCQLPSQTVNLPPFRSTIR